MKKSVWLISLILLIIIVSTILFLQAKHIPFFKLREEMASARIEKALDLEKRVFLNFKDVPLKAFFGFLSKKSKVKMVVDEEVKGIISIKTEATTLREILDRVTREKNLKYEIKKGAIYITKA